MFAAIQGSIYSGYVNLIAVICTYTICALWFDFDPLYDFEIMALLWPSTDSAISRVDWALPVQSHVQPGYLNFKPIDIPEKSGETT